MSIPITLFKLVIASVPICLLVFLWLPTVVALASASSRLWIVAILNGVFLFSYDAWSKLLPVHVNGRRVFQQDDVLERLRSCSRGTVLSYIACSSAVMAVLIGLLCLIPRFFT
jgi:hypothetical protein